MTYTITTETSTPNGTTTVVLTGDVREDGQLLSALGVDTELLTGRKAPMRTNGILK